MVGIFSTNIVADLEEGNKSMRGMACKMSPNVNIVITAEEGNSDLQLTQVTQSM